MTSFCEDHYLRSFTVENSIPLMSLYVLLDPREPGFFTARYVGATNSSLSRRLGQHLAPSKLRLDTPVATWLRELVAEGLRPLIALLERVPLPEWREGEIRQIKALRDAGHPLVNGHEGGTGPLAGGYVWSEESRLRLSRAKTGVKGARASSSYPGVCWHRATGKWMAQFRGRYLGVYEDEREAADAYRLAFRECFGQDPLGQVVPTLAELATLGDNDLPLAA